MKYINTTKGNIFVKVGNNMILVTSGSEIISKDDLRGSGLTIIPQETKTPKSNKKSVKTNELPKTNSSKN